MKGPQDWVIQADHDEEHWISKRLKSLFPEDGFLGKESEKHQLDATGGWMVEPIDGTSCFLMGIPVWCVSIAFLLQNGSTPIGVIYQPCTDELHTSDPETGARIHGSLQLGL